MRTILFSVLLPIFFASCNDWNEKIVGQWQATFISVDGQQLEMDYSPVNFYFNTNGQYTYNSTIDYKEQGTYYVNGDILFTLDTLNTASTEKAVQILNLTTDSLYLKMMTNGKDKLMKMHRVN